MKKLTFVGIALVIIFALMSGQGFAAVKQYKVPVISDFTGAWAELFKAWIPMHKAVFAWWNDNVGKGLGIDLELKHYDGRNEPPTIASMWPGILAECNPVIALGGGGADVAALQQRLPKDKVPTIYGTASYGYGWLPNQWFFQVRPTFAHEMIAGINWYIQQHPEKRPLKVGSLNCQIPPALDTMRGWEKYILEVLEPKGLAKIVAKEFCDVNPVDVSSQVKTIIDAKADLVLGPATAAMTSAYIRGCQIHGTNIPSLAAPHHSIYPFGRAMKNYAPMEGHLVVAAHASVVPKDSMAYKFFQVLEAKYGMKEDQWNPYNMMALCQSILAVRAVEHAAKKVGGGNLTGQAIYDAILAQPFTHEELMGVLPTLFFTKEAPFSTKDLKVMIETVKNGKYALATSDWIPIPTDVKKW